MTDINYPAFPTAPPCDMVEEIRNLLCAPEAIKNAYQEYKEQRITQHPITFFHNHICNSIGSYSTKLGKTNSLIITILTASNVGYSVFMHPSTETTHIFVEIENLGGGLLDKHILADHAALGILIGSFAASLSCSKKSDSDVRSLNAIATPFMKELKDLNERYAFFVCCLYWSWQKPEEFIVSRLLTRALQKELITFMDLILGIEDPPNDEAAARERAFRTYWEEIAKLYCSLFQWVPSQFRPSLSEQIARYLMPKEKVS